MPISDIEHLAEFVLGMNENDITQIFSDATNKELMDILLEYHNNPEAWDITVFKDRLDTLYERRLLASRLSTILSTKSGTTSEELQWYRDQSDHYRWLCSTLHSLTKSYKPSK